MDSYIPFESLQPLLDEFIPSSQFPIIDLSTPTGKIKHIDLFRRHGTYRAKLNSDDSTGWVVIHWPVLASYILHRKFGQPHYALQPGYVHQRQQDGKGDPDFMTLWVDLRERFESLCHPMTTAFWVDSADKKYFFGDLLLGTPPTDHESSELYSILRVPQVVYRKGPGRFSAYSFASHIPGRLSEELRNGLPDYLQLLLDALERARYSRNPLADCGLLWTRRGLYFNHGIAADNMYSSRSKEHAWALNAKYADKDSLGSFYLYPIDPGRDTLTARQWENITGDETPKEVRGTVSLKSLFIPGQDMEYAIKETYHLTEPLLTCTHHANDAHVLDYSTLRRLFYRLEYHNEVLTKPKSDRPKTKVAPVAEVRRQYTHKAPLLSVNMTSFDPTIDTRDGIYLQMYISHEARTHFIAIPEIFIDHIKDLHNKHVFVRRSCGGKNKTHLRIPTGKNQIDYKYVPIYREPLLNKTVCVDKDGRIYLHPHLMRPDGEFFLVTETYIEELVHPVEQPYLKHVLEIFNSIMRWVFQPELFIQGPCPLEFEILVQGYAEVNGKKIPCPVVLNSVEERLEFLYDQAVSRARAPIALWGKPGEHGRRSYRANSWDRFTTWYANFVEVPSLPVHLNRRQISEYIAKRWCLGRRPEAIYSQVQIITRTREQELTDGKIRIGDTDKFKDVDALVLWADKNLGPAF